MRRSRRYPVVTALDFLPRPWHTSLMRSAETRVNPLAVVMKTMTVKVAGSTMTAGAVYAYYYSQGCT
jgi:hypothetical protein